MDTERILRDALGDQLRADEPMARHTTLKVGGPARWFWAASDVETLARVLGLCARHDVPYLFLGHGSNVLMSDAGYDGLVIQNRCKGVSVGEETVAESGVSFGSLFLQTARAGFTGLEWAIGIPGTVGGALVSNAGAYRGNIGPLVQSLRVFTEGGDRTVGPDWMGFSYRDSRLRRAGRHPLLPPPPAGPGRPRRHPRPRQGVPGPAAGQAALRAVGRVVLQERRGSASRRDAAGPDAGDAGGGRRPRRLPD
jgi:hypothetical protein